MKSQYCIVIVSNIEMMFEFFCDSAVLHAPIVISLMFWNHSWVNCATLQ